MLPILLTTIGLLLAALTSCGLPSRCCARSHDIRSVAFSAFRARASPWPKPAYSAYST